MAYDAVVIGAGPAGLSAALQLARFNRRVAIIDSGKGRSTYHQINHNYLGFPGGVSARELRELSRKQVRQYPVAFVDEAAVAVSLRSDLFTATTESGDHVSARTVVFATGVRDHFPAFTDWESYVGRSIFWCIVCDGYSTRGKSVVAIGNDDDAAVTALQFLQFTGRVTLLTNAAGLAISPKAANSLRNHDVRLVEAKISQVHGRDGIVERVDLVNGDALAADYIFSLQGSSPNSTLAASLGVATNAAGYILTDKDQQTNVPGAFAAGDVTRDLAHQVATAVHEGITAATAAQYHLYEPWQRH